MKKLYVYADFDWLKEIEFIGELGYEKLWTTAILSTQPWIFSQGDTKINSSPSYPPTSHHLKYLKYMENVSLTA